MGDQPIYISENYRSGFLLRMKKVNGKVSGVWVEISSHNAQLDATLGELNKLIKELKLEEHISLNNVSIGKPEQQSNDWRYYCRACNSDIPAFKDQAENMKLYCGKCGRWQNFEKKLKQRE